MLTMPIEKRLSTLESCWISLEARVSALEKTVSVLSKQLNEFICSHQHQDKATKNRFTIAERSINKVKKKIEKSIKSACLAVDVANEAKYCIQHVFIQLVKV